MHNESEPQDNPTPEMKTAIQKAELLGKISTRLQQRISEANKLFKKWQSARNRLQVADKELDDYIKGLRRCHRLQRAERRLAA